MMNHDELTIKARELRQTILEMCVSNGGHIATSFSCVEIFVALFYGGGLSYDPKKPDWSLRDRFFLSKGHAETILYAVLADVGYFHKDWLTERYRKGDCKLGGHPDHNIPGVEITSGALGHGLGIASGISLADKMDCRNGIHHFVLMGDAECTEGSVWEAAMFAGKHQLDNLTAIVDRNYIGSLDFTDSYTGLEPFEAKWQAFGWETHVLNGHSCSELLKAFSEARRSLHSKPLVIIAETVKGKGVSFMENDPVWHVKQLSEQCEIEVARNELEKGRYDCGEA